MSASRRKYVAKGVPGGWRIWNSKMNKWWGEFYELQPDELVFELNNLKRSDVIVELNRRYQKAKR